MEDYEILYADTHAELYRKAEGREILSLKELIQARNFMLEEILVDLNLPLTSIKKPDQSWKLARSIIEEDISLLRERITTCTHLIRVEDGFLFTEWQLPSGSENIVDGGIPYPDEAIQKESRFLSEKAYKHQSGGCYPLKHWSYHPVFRAAVGNNQALDHYAKIQTALNLSRVSSPGRESIWCPQSLPLHHGRAFSLGNAGDALYPVNHTTHGLWAALKANSA